MAHRAEEKERRRQERLAQEEAARRAASRKRTLQIGGGAVLGLAVIAVIAIVALAGGGDSKGDSTVQRRPKLAADAKAAGCTLLAVQVRGPQPHGGQGHLQDQPAHLGQPQPDAGAGRLLPRRQLAAQGELRPLARARAHRVPVQAGHAGGRRGQAAQAGRGAAQRQRRLPRPDVREQHEHAGPVRRDRLDEVDHLPGAERRGRSAPCASSARRSRTRAPSSSRSRRGRLHPRGLARLR